MDKAKGLLVTSYGVAIVNCDNRAELNVIQKPHKQGKTIHITRKTNPEKVVPNNRDSKEEGERVTDR